ncbi:MAG: ABC transporter permease [Chloroflexi bacterium]|nr:MAG: ABC transporter permease [Chloroflexota bacterium]
MRGALLPPQLTAITSTRAGSLTIFIVRRILWMVPILFFVILITFTLMHLAPGSPWDKAGGRQLSDTVVNNLNIRYGLNKPVPQQFLLYISSVVHFDFGLSYQYQGKTVSGLLLESWPYTATIGVLAFLLIIPVGVGLGVLAALRQNTRVDYITMGFATVAASFPNFVIGALMVVALSVLAYKATGGNFFLPAAGFGVDDHLIMPVVTLARRDPAHIEELADPGRQDSGADVRVPRYGFCDRGDGVQHPWNRAGICGRDRVARLPHDPRHYGPFLIGDRGGESHR